VVEAVIFVLLKVIAPLVVLRAKPTAEGVIDHVPAGKEPLAGCGVKTIPLPGLLLAHRGLSRIIVLLPCVL